MTPVSRRVEWTVWGGLVLIILTIVVLFALTRIQSRQPSLPVLGEVPEFMLTNQMGNAISRSSLQGQIWVANIIFTRCPGPCTQMTKRMADLQKSLSSAPNVKLISLTTDPEYDTPAVLGKYGERFGAIPDRWWFLTGGKAQITRLAIEGLKLTALPSKPEDRTSENDLFIHSTIFILGDQQGRLRGVFESLEPGAHQQMVKAVQQLLKEKLP